MLRERMEERRKRNRRKGFTLVELMVVIAIIAILAAIAIPQYLKYTAKAKKSNVLQTTKELATAISNLGASALTNEGCADADSITIDWDSGNKTLKAMDGSIVCDNFTFNTGLNVNLSGVTMDSKGEITGTINVSGYGYNCTCDLPVCNVSCTSL